MRIEGTSAIARPTEEASLPGSRAEIVTPGVIGTKAPLPKEEAVPEPKRPQARAEGVERVADKLNRTAALFNVQAKFSVHKKTHEIMVKIVDTRTGQIIREIPPEKMLDLAASMQEMLGLVVDAKA